MLRNAVLVVAAAAAAALAAGQPASAHQPRADAGAPGTGVASSARSSEGLVVLADTDVAPAYICVDRVLFDVLGLRVPADDTGVLNALTGALGVWLDGGASAGRGYSTESDECPSGVVLHRRS